MQTVSIRKVRQENIDHAVRQALSDLGGLSKFVASGAHVLIKPNLICARDHTTGSTTNPAVVEAIAHCVRDAGAAEVLIGDGSGVGHDTRRVFQTLKYDELACRCGASLVDLNRDAVEMPCPGGTLLQSISVSRTALEADVLMNVPVLKTHTGTVVSLSLKNTKGVLPHSGKRKLHFIGLEQGIVDLNRLVTSHLIVADGTIGQEGQGPVAGEPVALGLIVAGANRVAVDATCCRIMGIRPETVPVMHLASEAGLGPMSAKEITLLGETLSRIRRPFVLPRYDFSPCEGVQLFAGTACSGCVGQVALALRELRLSGELESIQKSLGHINIVYGTNAPIPDAGLEGASLYIGKCQREARDRGSWVPGCPVHLTILEDALRHAAGLPVKNTTWFEVDYE